MSFYKSIAEYYDKIFPFNKNQLNFIIESIKHNKHKDNALDIGCSTGSLTEKLSKYFNYVTGIDLDSEMIKYAHIKNKEHKNLSFLNLDMLKLYKYFSTETFDLIVCFGNTLVHLENFQQIKNVINQIYSILKPGGTFLLQILNYKYILENNLNHLPIINNEEIRFEREYEFSNLPDSIIFKTALKIKASGEMINNKISLYPITYDKLYLILKSATFNSITPYEDFNFSTLNQKSLPLVIKASK